MTPINTAIPQEIAFNSQKILPAGRPDFAVKINFTKKIRVL